MTKGDGGRVADLPELTAQGILEMDALEAELARDVGDSMVCMWTWTGDYLGFETDCANYFLPSVEFAVFDYCPFCGKKLRVY